MNNNLDIPLDAMHIKRAGHEDGVFDNSVSFDRHTNVVLARRKLKAMPDDFDRLADLAIDNFVEGNISDFSFYECDEGTKKQKEGTLHLSISFFRSFAKGLKDQKLKAAAHQLLRDFNKATKAGWSPKLRLEKSVVEEKYLAGNSLPHADSAHSQWGRLIANYGSYPTRGFYNKDVIVSVKAHFMTRLQKNGKSYDVPTPDYQIRAGAFGFDMAHGCIWRHLGGFNDYNAFPFIHQRPHTDAVRFLLVCDRFT